MAFGRRSSYRRRLYRVWHSSFSETQDPPFGGCRSVCDHHICGPNVSPAGVADMYSRARQAYLNGDYQVVEGAVSNFHPMPYSGHQNESFSVNGVQFSYSDYVVSPCFNNTTSHGGPIGEGLRVRIAYSGDCILKLEIARR